MELDDILALYIYPKAQPVPAKLRLEEGTRIREKDFKPHTEGSSPGADFDSMDKKRRTLSAARTLSLAISLSPMS